MLPVLKVRYIYFYVKIGERKLEYTVSIEVLYMIIVRHNERGRYHNPENIVRFMCLGTYISKS